MESSSYCWSKSLDDCLKELKWPPIHNVILMFLFAKFMMFFTIEILFPFLIIFIYPMFTISIFDLLHQQLTHIVIHFLLTVLFCGIQFQSIPLCLVSFSVLTIKIVCVCIYTFVNVSFVHIVVVMCM